MPLEGLFPRGGPRPTSSQAERNLYDALKGALPKGWVAWHSLKVRTDQGVEGESDFVIADPDRGFLIVEVKGGQIEVRDGQWLQNGSPLKKSPREQGHRVARAVRQKLEERGRGYSTFRIVTAFPDTGWDQPPTQGDLEGAVLGRADLPYLSDALPAIADRLWQSGERGRPDRSMVRGLHEIWGETWKPSMGLGTRAKLREEELVPLDEEQLHFLDAIEDNPRFLVYGGAGSGKTLLARETVRRLKERGKRPVLLCFTKGLGQALREEAGLDAYTVKDFAVQLVQRAEIDLEVVNNPSQWDADTWALVTLQAAADCVPLAREDYDAFVIDEAQDFDDSDWELIKALAEGCPLYGFGDRAQGFWWNRNVNAELFGATFKLMKRYRCPEKLATFADLYRPRPKGEALPEDALADLRPFKEFTVVQAISETNVEEKVANEIQKALGAGLDPGDIAVITIAGMRNTRLCAGDKIGSHEVRRVDATDTGDHIIADTFLRFKGLERPWIIITDLALGKPRYDIRMHIAMTRATLGCVVVGTADEIAEDERLVKVQACQRPP